MVRCDPQLKTTTLTRVIALLINTSMNRRGGANSDRWIFQALKRIQLRIDYKNATLHVQSSPGSSRSQYLQSGLPATVLASVRWPRHKLPGTCSNQDLAGPLEQKILPEQIRAHNSDLSILLPLIPPLASLAQSDTLCWRIELGKQVQQSMSELSHSDAQDHPLHR